MFPTTSLLLKKRRTLCSSTLSSSAFGSCTRWGKPSCTGYKERRGGHKLLSLHRPIDPPRGPATDLTAPLVPQSNFTTLETWRFLGWRPIPCRVCMTVLLEHLLRQQGGCTVARRARCTITRPATKSCRKKTAVAALLVLVPRWCSLRVHQQWRDMKPGGTMTHRS